MSLVTRTVLLCDACDKQVDIIKERPDRLRFGGAAASDEVRGWRAVEEGYHLCPDCSRVYAEKEAAMKRELQSFYGGRTIDIYI